MRESSRALASAASRDAGSDGDVGDGAIPVAGDAMGMDGGIAPAAGSDGAAGIGEAAGMDAGDGDTAGAGTDSGDGAAAGIAGHGDATDGDSGFIWHF